MARHLSVASVIDKNKVSSATPWLVLLDVFLVDPNTRETVDTLRIVKNTENVLFGTDAEGNPIVYQAGNFDMSVDQKQNGAPTVSITARDQTGYIESRMEAMAGGIFSEVQMTVVNSDRLDQEPEIQERFQILNADAKDHIVTFQLGAENPLNISFPKHRQFADRCAWRYRGYGCRYAGPLASCDYSRNGPNGCRAHDNVENFRGLPGLVRMNV